MLRPVRRARRRASHRPRTHSLRAAREGGRGKDRGVDESARAGGNGRDAGVWGEDRGDGVAGSGGQGVAAGMGGGC